MKIKKKSLLILSVFGCLLLLFGVVGIVLVSKRTSSCMPVNIFLSKEGDNVVQVSWETKDLCLGYVLYGESSYEIERVVVNTENLEKSKNHEVTIPNLLSTNAYYFIVVSDEYPYGKNGKAIAFSLEDIE